MSEQQLTNKVAESGIVTIDLEKYLPKEDIVVFDLKDFLFMGLILKEKDFRQSLKELDTAKFTNKNVAITCSADAIIPMWAYMLVTSLLQPISKEIYFGNEQDVQNKILFKNIYTINTIEYLDKRVVIKGCGERQIPEEAFIEITKLLRPVVKSIMYGEPCSTVPVYKQAKN